MTRARGLRFARERAAGRADVLTDGPTRRDGGSQTVVQRRWQLASPRRARFAPRFFDYAALFRRGRFAVLPSAEITLVARRLTG